MEIASLILGCRGDQLGAMDTRQQRQRRLDENHFGLERQALQGGDGSCPTMFRLHDHLIKLAVIRVLVIEKPEYSYLMSIENLNSFTMSQQIL